MAISMLEASFKDPDFTAGLIMMMNGQQLSFGELYASWESVKGMSYRVDRTTQKACIPYLESSTPDEGVETSILKFIIIKLNRKNSESTIALHQADKHALHEQSSFPSQVSDGTRGQIPERKDPVLFGVAIHTSARHHASGHHPPLLQ